MFSRNARGEWRLSPWRYKAVLTAHILVSVGWLGAALGKLVLGLVALTISLPDVSQSLYGAMEALNIVFPRWPSAQS